VVVIINAIHSNVRTYITRKRYGAVPRGNQVVPAQREIQAVSVPEVQGDLQDR
jgi:hypothetical protein